MTSLVLVASALEFVLFLAASVIFISMVVTAVAVVTWLVAGFTRATHP
jgi:hypothetical protein